MRPDDAFWAAGIVSKFSDEAIRAVVAKAKYSDAAATEYLSQVLITRRDKVVAAWLNQVCPVVDAALTTDGTLTFANAAIDARAATPPAHYELRWFRFDNATNERTASGEAVTVSAPSARAPAGLVTSGDFIGVSVAAKHPQHAGWANPATFFFRRASGQGATATWELVGVERGEVKP
jgi:hypothetical protein